MYMWADAKVVMSVLRELLAAAVCLYVRYHLCWLLAAGVILAAAMNLCPAAIAFSFPDCRAVIYDTLCCRLMACPRFPCSH